MNFSLSWLSTGGPTRADERGGDTALAAERYGLQYSSSRPRNEAAQLCAPSLLTEAKMALSSVRASALEAALTGPGRQRQLSL